MNLDQKYLNNPTNVSLLSGLYLISKVSGWSVDKTLRPKYQIQYNSIYLVSGVYVTSHCEPISFQYFSLLKIKLHDQKVCAILYIYTGIIIKLCCLLKCIL